jgi:hypothetical protein
MHLAAGNGRHEICQLLAPIPTVTILTSNDEGTFLIVDLKYILNCVINCAPLLQGIPPSMLHCSQDTQSWRVKWQGSVTYNRRLRWVHSS